MLSSSLGTGETGVGAGGTQDPHPGNDDPLREEVGTDSNPGAREGGGNFSLERRPHPSSPHPS